jgi:hypothetical protein
MLILIPLEGPSATGLQAKELMGLTVNSINELADSDVTNFEKFYDELYLRAYRALLSDAQKILSGFYKYPDGTYVSGKFNFNKKISTLETSEFISVLQGNAGYAGARITWPPSQYSVANVGIVNVFIKTLQSPSIVTLRIYDNTLDPLLGGLLYEKEFPVNAGLNSLPVFFNVNTVDFSILIDLADQVFYQSKQKFYYNGEWIDQDISCSMPCAGGAMISYQINGGGVNAFVTALCSLERFIEQNFALFQFQLYYSIGREFMKERITSDRVNQYTVISLERATQLLTLYETDYVNALDSLRSINQIPEDFQCFNCKSVLSTKNLLP